MSSHLTSDAENRAERDAERLTQLAMHLGDPLPAVREVAERSCETLWPHELDTLTTARRTMANLMLKLALMGVGK